MELRTNKNAKRSKVAEPAPVDAEAITLEVLNDRVGKSLELKINAGLKEDIGIHYHNGLPYTWKLWWTLSDDGKIMHFQMEIWEVRPYMRNGKPTNRKPQLLKVVERNFNQEVTE